MRALEEPARDRMIQLIERFEELHPPFYKGKSESGIVEEWVQEMEMIFMAIRCSEVEKVDLTSFVLQDEAEERCQSAK